MPCHLRTFLVAIALLLTGASCAVNAGQQVPQDLRLQRPSTSTAMPEDVLPPLAIARLGAVRFAARKGVGRSGHFA